jgi:multimeric flavodoxin WrbA
MGIKVLGISGSPINDSNTDRLVKAVLDATGVESEFVKLSTINVRPCLACKKCVPDNVCKVDDDFPELAEKIKSAQALVIGGYTPYSQIDGFTKALLERFWSFRHQKNLLKGKMVATVLTGVAPEALAAVNQSLAAEFRDYENMDLLGQLTIPGSIVCAFCGKGDDCEMSGFKSRLIDTGTKVSDYKYPRVEDQQEVWEEALRIGRLMGERLN